MNDLKKHELEEAEDMKPRFLRWIGKRKAGAAIVILLLFSAVMVRMLVSAADRQTELEQQVALQNEVIDGLRADAEKDSDKPLPVITSETLKARLGPLQELVTQEYIYTNADKRESKDTWIFGWTRPFSENSLLVTYDGTIKAGIDFGAIEISVNEESRAITVTLPASTITDNIIPQESITVVEVKNGLFNEVTIDDYNEFISEQKIIMEQKAIDRGLLASADEQARTLVKDFLSSLPGMDTYTLSVK